MAINLSQIRPNATGEHPGQLEGLAKLVEAIASDPILLPVIKGVRPDLLHDSAEWVRDWRGDVSPPVIRGSSIGPEGLALLQAFEALAKVRSDGNIEAYLDPVGVWTIGWGTTRINGQPIQPGTVITREQADAYKLADLRGFAADVDRLIHESMQPHERDAAISFCYNVGAAQFSSSSFRRFVNQGNKQAAADALLPWNKGGGRVLSGLSRRRAAERAMFLGIGWRAYLGPQQWELVAAVYGNHQWQG